ncbi:26S proteasome ATPase subunit [Theileria orientalis strain Shintoku]|uniref:26S proteasome ATPase subunit n=1 Tax=Theileria orientalis strain Shintoku TaxID=869250 RepID=J7MCA1_THEOR|nr:26S proteasome ATPase subunit [Theileria orientalis strain Shintoku]BAM42382.1 26S proteasome ATPase subunit [Theileria orientalis strain Shintoku]|eukprot:XP_009692683.1 26S proteasome ATPase subunit [Theileria orientalis strain Shintoku]
MSRESNQPPDQSNGSNSNPDSNNTSSPNRSNGAGSQQTSNSNTQNGSINSTMQSTVSNTSINQATSNPSMSTSSGPSLGQTVTSNSQQPAATQPNVGEDREVMMQYVRKVREHRELESKLKKLRTEMNELNQKDNKTEEDLKALQSIGQIVGHVLRQIDDNKFIVKASSGPRYVVCCKVNIDPKTLVSGVRVALDMTTLTIMKKLPREVDPVVFNMLNDLTAVGKNKDTYSSIGGLSRQIREMREVIELPLKNPFLFKRVGIKAPKGVLLYGPPGTGKTLLARALANDIECNFLKVVASAVVDKYIGESAKIIREMFGYAKEHQPCIIFMDEVDAIGGRRFSQGTSADREIQRTLMELLTHLDGFDELGQVKIIMATNRPDVLDPALLRPGRIDRKIEIPLPNEAARIEILKIHAKPLNKQGEINYNAICKLCDGFNGADLRNICTEAGIHAIRNMRDYVIEEDFFKAARKLTENKKLEGTLAYEQI